jgi:hypothetical protein
MQRRRFDIFSMSFLDTICCAFGAIVLRMILMPPGAASTTAPPQPRRG